MSLIRQELSMDEVKTQLVGVLSRGYSWPELQREFKQIITCDVAQCADAALTEAEKLASWHMYALLPPAKVDTYLALLLATVKEQLGHESKWVNFVVTKGGSTHHTKLAQTYIQAQRFARAEAELRLALDYDELGLAAATVMTLANLIQVVSAQGRTDDALQLFRRARDILAKMPPEAVAYDKAVGALEKLRARGFK
jgi:tetratricopeptide (TPR) repeat protein